MDKYAKHYKNHLKHLTKAVIGYLNRLDKLMKEPSSNERGQKIAKLCNDLEIANDSALMFGLGMTSEKIKKMKGIK